MKARLFTDGGARGNPGPAAYGFVLEADDGTVLAAEGQPIGVATNNVAEYRAFLRALQEAAALGARTVQVWSDSELLVNQLSGHYKVRSPTLAPLHRQAVARMRQFDQVDVKHVPREQNQLADALANRALDEAERSGRS